MPVSDDGTNFPYTAKGRKAKREYEEKQRAAGASQGGNKMKTYHGGGLLDRSPDTPYGREVSYAKGGGAARKDSTRWYKPSGSVTS